MRVNWPRNKLKATDCSYLRSVDIATREIGQETTLTAMAEKPGLGEERCALMRENLCGVKSKEQGNTVVRKSGSTKAVSLAISLLERGQCATSTDKHTQVISRTARNTVLAFINGLMAPLTKAGILMTKKKVMASFVAAIIKSSRVSGVEEREKAEVY